MDKEKLLDEYIKERFADLEPLTDKDRKVIADSLGFEGFVLSVAWEELKASIKHSFPFNLLFK